MTKGKIMAFYPNLIQMVWIVSILVGSVLPGRAVAQTVEPAALRAGLDDYANAHKMAEIKTLRGILRRRPYQCVSVDQNTCGSTIQYNEWSAENTSGIGILSYKISDKVVAVLSSEYIVYGGFMCTDPRKYEDKYIADVSIDVNDEVRETYRELVDADSEDVTGMVCNGVSVVDGEVINVALAIRENKLRVDEEPVAFLAEPYALRLSE